MATLTSCPYKRQATLALPNHIKVKTICLSVSELSNEEVVCVCLRHVYYHTEV